VVKEESGTLAGFAHLAQKKSNEPVFPVRIGTQKTRKTGPLQRGDAESAPLQLARLFFES